MQGINSIMSEKYKNKYRISSARLKNWDYSANGAYFITICTQNREHFFGEVVEGQFITSELGRLAGKYWLEIPSHFPFVELGNFVVMPNHTHGILIINKNNIETLHCNVSITNTGITNTRITKTTDIQKNEQMARISPKPGSISTIIRSYKSVVSKNAHLIHSDFSWQSRFHDHIIRNSQELERIQYYIENNPLNWKEDKFS